MENRFFNRELSWLEFNARVLFQALRKELPLLERLQFLSIVTSNFDEFFQVRVASVKRLLAEDPSSVDVSGLTSQLVLTSISARAHQIIRTQHNCLMNDILPKLAEKGYVYVSSQDYSPQQTEFLQGVFKNEIYPPTKIAFRVCSWSHGGSICLESFDSFDESSRRVRNGKTCLYPGSCRILSWNAFFTPT